jgi:multiple sugar transport system permease protein
MLPTLLSVMLVVVLPLLAIFWISAKPVDLADLRPPAPVVREDLRDADGEATIRYRIRNSSQSGADPERRPHRHDSPRVAPGDAAGVVHARWFGARLRARGSGGRRAARARDSRRPERRQAGARGGDRERDAGPSMTGDAENILTNLEFTWENFRAVFDAREFWTVIWATLFYTVFGTFGALIVGLFAALLLNRSFRGQGVLRGLYLFPYVAPVIAVAFTWVILFDPFSGIVNALLVQMGVTDEAINFFGQRPLALIMVTVFEIWRYFPLSFLFILARMQSIDHDMYEAADVDGASPFQKFRYLSLPMLMGILSVLFLLRFIWTFNKFDDIFLLTGGNAGTRTLTVNVYEQAFALSNIGAGAAVAVVILLCLLVFSWAFFRFMSREEGL